MGYVLNFNGVDSKIDCGVPDTLVGDISISTWVKPYSYGEGNAGHIISTHADGINLFITTSDNKVSFSKDGGGHTASAANNTIILSKWMHIIVTSVADGTSNIYLNGILSGSADQAAGTLGETVDLLIGNRSAEDRTFDGLINDVCIYSGILTANEANQAYTESKARYGQ